MKQYQSDTTLLFFVIKKTPIRSDWIRSLESWCENPIISVSIGTKCFCIGVYDFVLQS